jgi:hypothetical protein
VQKIAFGFVPSLTDFAFVLPIGLLFFVLGGTGTLLADGDPGWHLRAGEWILANGRVPHADLFSFTRAGQPWFAWEWLWEAAFAGLHRWGGMAAVILASVAVLAATMCLLFRLAVRVSGNAVTAIALTVVACGASSVHFIARPHLFTLLFTTVFLWILETERRRAAAGERISVRWLLPALTVLWANLHGGFITGIPLTAAYGAGTILRDLSRGESARHAWLAGRSLVMTAALCLAASLANPYGYRLHWHVYQFLTDSFPLLHIVEFQPLDFHSPAARFFEVLLVVGCLAGAWSVLKRRFEHALVLAAWAHMALMSARNIPIFAILLTPIAALCIEEWLEGAVASQCGDVVKRSAKRLLRLGAETAAMEGLPRFYTGAAASLLALAAILYAPNPPEKFRPSYNAERFPVRAMTSIPDGPSRVFTADAWAGYLIYKQFPIRKVFVDGRSDFYGDSMEKVYRDILYARPGWRQLLDSYRIDAVLLPPDSALVSTLRLSTGWHPVYEDKTAVVFLAAHEFERAGANSSAARTARKSEVALPRAIRAAAVTNFNQERRGA